MNFLGWAIPAGIVAAAPEAIAGLGIGILASTLTSSGLDAIGAAPEYSRFAGDLAGLLGGGTESSKPSSFAAKVPGEILQRMNQPWNDLGEADAAFHPGDGAGKGVIYTNQPGMSVLIALMSHALGQKVPDMDMTGFAFDRAGTAALRKSLPTADLSAAKQFGKIARRNGMTDAQIEHFRSILNQAAQDSDIVALDASDPDVDMNAIHEGIHRQQGRLPASGYTLDHITLRDLITHANAQNVAGPLSSTIMALHNQGYDHMLIPAEIGAWLGSGMHGELGLTESEAHDVLEHYFRVLLANQNHGSRAGDVLDAMLPDVQTVMRNRIGGLRNQNSGGGTP